MPKKPLAKSSSARRAEGTKDVFARCEADIVDELDQLVEQMQPRTTRSAFVAYLIRQYVETERAKRKG